MLPINCIVCQQKFSPKYTKNIYCSRSCSARINNSKHPKRIKKTVNYCKCGKEIAYQSINCQQCDTDIKANNILELWRSNNITSYKLPNPVRKFLLEKANFSCIKCGFNTPHPIDNKTVLEINHINGNGIDHSPNNLEVICPNCHALTSSYRGRNAGHGRPMSYLRRYK